MPAGRGEIAPDGEAVASRWGGARGCVLDLLHSDVLLSTSAIFPLLFPDFSSAEGAANDGGRLGRKNFVRRLAAPLRFYSAPGRPTGPLSAGSVICPRIMRTVISGVGRPQ